MSFRMRCKKLFGIPEHLEHWRRISLLMLVFDIVAVSGSLFFALWARFDFSFSAIPEGMFLRFQVSLPFYVLICLLLFWHFRMYNIIWRFAGIHELLLTVYATACCLVAELICTMLLPQLFFPELGWGRLPWICYGFGIVLQYILTVGVRLSYRVVLAIHRHWGEGKSRTNLMIIGAGAAGHMLLRDIGMSHSEEYKVCCLIDDNSNKWERYIDGVPVVGGRNDILFNVKKYKIDQIILAIPSATLDQRREILSICNETGCELRQVSMAYREMNQVVDVSAVRAVAIEDLLGRDTIRIDMNEVFQSLTGKVILVTGGGGSIGSELCRQIAAHDPKTLIIFDIYENNAYSIQLELREKYPKMDLVTLIGSVRDSRRLDDVFAAYRPEIVFHAAAHKHVPLMEDSPCESVKNNVFGTYKTAYAAMLHGCRRFVLISTDKAVNPTNVMGASKRLCEMVIQSFDKKIKNGTAAEILPMSVHSDRVSSLSEPPRMELVALRFGNVLGSNGSVVPLFKKQIAKGGPVTVTHPDIIRYFMTVSEAVSLVLQASVYAKGGEIFVLDMGQPVKIDSLARNLIKLAGLRPDVDIKIEYTGLRPGEKLYEEKLMAEEGLMKTANDLIFVGHPLDFDPDEFLGSMDELYEAAYANREDIRDLICDLVPTYQNLSEKREAAPVSQR